jgi:hypothetical protein
LRNGKQGKNGGQYPISQFHDIAVLDMLLEIVSQTAGRAYCSRIDFLPECAGSPVQK